MRTLWRSWASIPRDESAAGSYTSIVASALSHLRFRLLDTSSLSSDDKGAKRDTVQDMACSRRAAKHLRGSVVPNVTREEMGSSPRFDRTSAVLIDERGFQLKPRRLDCYLKPCENDTSSSSLKDFHILAVSFFADRFLRIMHKTVATVALRRAS